MYAMVPVRTLEDDDLSVNMDHETYLEEQHLLYDDIVVDTRCKPLDNLSPRG